MGKISGSEMNNPDHIFSSLATNYFGLKYLNSLLRIRDPGWKIRIRDKHLGSATLVGMDQQLLLIGYLWLIMTFIYFVCFDYDTFIGMSPRNDKRLV